MVFKKKKRRDKSKMEMGNRRDTDCEGLKALRYMDEESKQARNQESRSI